jgi:hypothetical protein
LIAAMLADQHQPLSIAASQFGNSRSIFGNLMMYCTASRSFTRRGNMIGPKNR